MTVYVPVRLVDGVNGCINLVVSWSGDCVPTPSPLGRSSVAFPATVPVYPGYVGGRRTSVSLVSWDGRAAPPGPITIWRKRTALSIMRWMSVYATAAVLTGTRLTAAYRIVGRW